MHISPVCTYAHSAQLNIDMGETLRYMGCGTQATEEIASLAARAIEAVQGAASCKACYMHCEIAFPQENVVDFGFMQIQSAGLYRHLKCCKSVYIFAATVGLEIDRLIFQYKHSSPSFALAVQAAGAAAVESYCDLLCAEVFEKEAEKQKRHTIPRFSAGYDDLSLEVQKQIVAALDCTRQIGLTLTDGCMMMPSKSVTAFVGISDIKMHTAEKCSVCSNTECVFRKGSDL